MAQISLGNLRDLWQNVSDWVKGVDTVSAPSVKLTGSNATLIKEYLNQNQHIGLIANKLYATDVQGSIATSTPIEVTKFKNKFIHVRNGYDQSIQVTVTAFTKTVVGGGIAFNLVASSALAAGASKQWFTDDAAKLGAPVIGLAVGVYTSVAPTTGNIDIVMLGGSI
jgi:hypothetical protein